MKQKKKNKPQNISKDRKISAFSWKIAQYSYISKLNIMNEQTKKCVKYHADLNSKTFPVEDLSHVESMLNCCINLSSFNRKSSGLFFFT